MLGFGDPKKRIVAVINSMKNDREEKVNPVEAIKEPVQMLLDAFENKDVEGISHMLAKIFHILNGKFEE